MAQYVSSEMNGNIARQGRGRLPALICAASSLVLFMLLFYPAYRVLWSSWQREDNNYCYFVPLIVLYLLWEKRAALQSVPAVSSWAGFAPFLFGIACYWLGELGGEFYTIYLGSWFVLTGFVWICLGWHKLKIAAFPLLFLITMFPFPRFINNNLTLQLKLLSSKMGVAMMHWYGLAAYREGNVIDLGFTRLQVVDACSGLRYFFPLIVLSILLAYYFRAPLWKKVVLVLSAVAVSVITNGMRIASVGILYQFWGPAVAEGFFHDFSGWFIFMFSLGLLLLEMWLLKRLFPALPEVARVHDAPAYWGASSGLTARDGKVAVISVVPRFLAAVAVLGATLALAHGVEFREKVPIKKSFAQFPEKVGEWTGIRRELEQLFRDALEFSDYVIIDYTNREGKNVNFYTAYYETQRKGGSIHSPASCLPGSGWELKESGNVTVPSGDGRGGIRVRRAFMQMGGKTDLVYYWFPQRGRILTDIYEMKFFTFWDALTRQRTDGALVRVITPVYQDEGVEAAEARLQAFTRQIVPVLDACLPGKESI